MQDMIEKSLLCKSVDSEHFVGCLLQYKNSIVGHCNFFGWT